MKRLATCVLPLLVLGAPTFRPATALAQEATELTGELPLAVVEEVIAFHNRPETIRLSGESSLPPGSRLVGNVAVVGGLFTIDGAIDGDVIVINGDAHVGPDADVSGSLTVVGGDAVRDPSARLGAAIVVYREPLRFRRDDDLLTYAGPPPDRSLAAGWNFPFGRTELTTRVRGGFNRVEGLPIAFGPRLRGNGSNPLQAEALLLYRSESGLSTDETGYVVRVEQFLGGHQTLRVGAQLHSEIVPIEQWGVSERENALATFLVRRDYRDYYERTGWATYLRLSPPGQPYDLTLEYRQEEHAEVPARGPWTLIGNDKEWRPQPLIASGRLRSVAARYELDTRNEASDPSTGWLLAAELETGLGGSLVHPAAPNDSNQVLLATGSANDTFLSGLVDLRRYVRVSPTSRLAMRVLAASSLNGDPLPPQRQHALGGAGSLPAYSSFGFDCGARAQEIEFNDQAFVPYYGCDHLTLLQLEYHSAIGSARGLIRRLGWDFDLGDTPSWVVFFDAGRSWNQEKSLEGRDVGLDDLVADAGVGLRIGQLGLYWAYPISGRNRSINFFVRLGHRL